MSALLFLLPGLLHFVEAIMQLCQGDALSKLHPIILHVVEARVEVLIAIQHHGIPASVPRFLLHQPLVLLLLLPQGIESQRRSCT
jgi:hypothetical protein